MPHIAVQMYPGRDQSEKEAIAYKLRDYLAKEMQADQKYFSVSVEEVKPENWQTQVMNQIKAENLVIDSNF